MACSLKNFSTLEELLTLIYDKFMTTTKRLLSSVPKCAFAALLGLASHSVASASLVDWTITSGAFSQGGTFTGTFTFDADVPGGTAVTNWSLSVTAGGGFTAFTYNPGDSSVSNGGNCCGGHEVVQFTSNASGAAKRYFSFLSTRTLPMPVELLTQ
jgi:hypothetical protein